MSCNMFGAKQSHAKKMTLDTGSTTLRETRIGRKREREEKKVEMYGVT